MISVIASDFYNYISFDFNSHVQPNMTVGMLKMVFGGVLFKNESLANILQQLEVLAMGCGAFPLLVCVRVIPGELTHEKLTG
jgi:hypothetical protein